MHNTNISGKQSYVLCKHMYNLFWLVLHADEDEGEFIHKNLWNPTTLHILFRRDHAN